MKNFKFIKFAKFSRDCKYCKHCKYYLSLLLTFIFCSQVIATDLKPPIDLPSAQVLPKGVRNFRYKGLNVNGNEKFNNQGEQRILADPFFKELTFRDLLDTSKEEIDRKDPINDEIDKAMLRGYLESNGYNLDDNVGTTTGAVSVAAYGHVPIFAYGLTDALTLAVAVPVVKYKFNVATGFAKKNNIQNATDSLAAEGKTYQQGEFVKKMSNPISVKLASFGYSPLEAEERTKLGDINLAAKYLVNKSDIWMFSIQGTLTLPTGSKADINKVIDIPGGDGQFDIGMTLLNEFSNLVPSTTFTIAIGNTIQFNDKLEKRIPYRQDSKLTADIDRRTSRDLGDIYFAQTGIKYAPAMGFNFNLGHAFQYKEADQYSGAVFPAYRYNWLAIETEQRMQTVQVGAGYSTLELFKNKKFPVPLEFNLNHSMVIAGKNVNKDPLTTVEFVMYF
ncbi:MAG: hypothetical protein HQK51_21580 [Oligoflexia bacterium]|nr:hypothetical protein [Oligoflexia bacterium]